MVRVGDTILIYSKGYVKAKITSLFLIGQERWFIGYEETDGTSGFFLEGDEEFYVINSGPSYWSTNRSTHGKTCIKG